MMSDTETPQPPDDEPDLESRIEHARGGQTVLDPESKLALAARGVLHGDMAKNLQAAAVHLQAAAAEAEERLAAAREKGDAAIAALREKRAAAQQPPPEPPPPPPPEPAPEA
jgi:hypothetical protein